jgi:hypothetical protein
MRIRWAGHLACMEEMRNACKIVDRKPGRFRHRGVDSIRKDLREIG